MDSDSTEIAIGQPDEAGKPQRKMAPIPTRLGKNKVVAGTRVRCSRQIHTVVLLENGKLVFLNHPHGRHDTSGVLLGLAEDGEKLPCWKCADWLAKAERYRESKVGAPTDWRKRLEDAAKKRSNRVRVNRDQSHAEFMWALVRAAADRAVTVFESFASVAKRRIGDHEKPSVHSAHNLYYNGADKIKFVQPVTFGDEHMMAFAFEVSMFWYTRVYLRGLALIDGFLVTDAGMTNQQHTEAKVTFVKPTHGPYLSVSCRANKGPDGVWHLPENEKKI